MPGEVSPPGSEISHDLTLPKLLVRTADRYGDRKVAMREKEHGIWRHVTWGQYRDNVKALALGLRTLGFSRGDKIAMIGDNRPEGLWTEMAALALGGVATWLYQDCLPDEIQYILDHSDATILAAEGQEEVDKVLAVKDRCPKLRWIIWDDPKGMRGYDDPSLINLREVQAKGRKVESEQPGLFERVVGEGKADDVALIFYTSGTTSNPKGAILTHYNMLKMGQYMMAVDPCRETEDFVSFLPFAWIGEQMMSISCGLLVGFTINFPEEPETTLQNIREIAPHVLFSPPRVYEQMVREVQVRHLDASSLKRLAHEWAMSIGYRIADLRFAKKPVRLSLRAAGWVADLLVHRKLRDHLGLSRVHHAYSGGAAMGPDHLRFFHAIGVNLKQIYGQTEISGISVLHRDADVKFDTVGKPLPETEVKITPDGEIVSRSPCVFKGYYKNPEATAEALEDGWLHSGDSGFIDADGHLVVFDRTKDIIILADGSRFSPQYLETRIKFSPYIKDTMVVGDKRPFVAGLVCIDYQVVGKWAETRKIPYTSYVELSQKPEVAGLVEQALRHVNEGLPMAARVHRFVNLYKEFDPDDDELTRTRKVRRAFVEERYREIIDGLYSRAGAVSVDSTIMYKDGRTAQIKTDLKIVDVRQET